MDGNDPDRSDQDADRTGMDVPAASALVILQSPPPEHGGSADGFGPPDPGQARRVQDLLRSLGFDVGALIGTSFSISAPPWLFQRSFGQAPPTEPTVETADGASHGPDHHELPVDRLPDEAAAAIEAIVFARPPDFGPGAP
jgi:hypothetical protein